MSFLQTRDVDFEPSFPGSQLSEPALGKALVARFVTMSGERGPRRAVRCELSLVVSGKALLERELPGDRAARRSVRTLATGDVFMASPGDELALREVRHLVLASVEFDSSRELSTQKLRSLAPLDKLLDAPADNALRLAAHHLDAVIDAFKRLREECEQADVGQELLLAALFYELLVVLARAAAAGDDDPERYRVRLAATLSFMNEHYREALTTEQLADTAGMSVQRFAGAFRVAFGSGPSEYLAGLRMREARELLRDEARSISEVATDVGYHDSEHFSLAFKHHYGLTPREFRQMARIGADSSAQPDLELCSQSPPAQEPRKKARGAAARLTPHGV